jgi:hypothetical protein
VVQDAAWQGDCTPFLAKSQLKHSIPRAEKASDDLACGAALGGEDASA